MSVFEKLSAAFESRDADAYSSFRPPPRFLNVIGAWMTMVSPVSRNYRLLFIPLPSCARRLTHQSGESRTAGRRRRRPRTQS